MENTQKPEVTREEVEHAHTLWINFTDWMKWGVVAVVIFLALMATFLV